MLMLLKTDYIFLHTSILKIGKGAFFIGVNKVCLLEIKYYHVIKYKLFVTLDLTIKKFISADGMVITVKDQLIDDLTFERVEDNKTTTYHLNVKKYT
jgi:hypothetical protein